MSRTFHDVHDGADVTLFNDEAAALVVDWVHAVDDLTNLSQFQILHKIVAHNGRFDQLSRSNFLGGRKNKFLIKYIHYLFIFFSSFSSINFTAVNKKKFI